MAITRAQFQALYEPGLREVSFEEYKAKEMIHEKVYVMEKSTQQTETEYDIVGLGRWNKKSAEGAPVQYEDLTPGATHTYTTKPWDKGSQITREALDDELYGQWKDMAKELGRTARITVEEEAASLFNNGFSADSTRNYDSVALFSASHPAYGPAGSTQSNLGASLALSDANLKTGRLAVRKMTNENGQKISADPDQLIVPDDLETVALELTMSALNPSNADNAVNTLKGRFKVIVWGYLTSTTAWFLRDSSIAKNKFFWRVKPEFGSETDFDTGNLKYKGYMRFEYGYSNWRGLWGTAGA